MLIYLHNIYVKIETRGRLKPLAYNAGRAADVKFTLRVLAVVGAKTGADALLATARLVSRYLTSVISSEAVLSDARTKRERTAT